MRDHSHGYKSRSSLYKLMDEASESHEPIQITGERHNAVLVSEEDWKSIQETISQASHGKHESRHHFARGYGLQLMGECGCLAEVQNTHWAIEDWD